MNEQLENKNLEQPGVETPEQNNNNQQYIDIIKDLKANTVSKDRYNQLMEENKTLLQSLVNGEVVTPVAPEVEKPPIEDLVNEMRGKNISDISFVEKALEFRDRVLEETGEDCFVSKGHNITPTQESYIAAQRTADIYKECLEYANGDNQAFINELQRRMIDNSLGNINNKINKRR